MPGDPNFEHDPIRLALQAVADAIYENLRDLDLIHEARAAQAEAEDFATIARAVEIYDQWKEFGSV